MSAHRTAFDKCSPANGHRCRVVHGCWRAALATQCPALWLPGWRGIRSDNTVHRRCLLARLAKSVGASCPLGFCWTRAQYFQRSRRWLPTPTRTQRRVQGTSRRGMQRAWCVDRCVGHGQRRQREPAAPPGGRCPTALLRPHTAFVAGCMAYASALALLRTHACMHACAIRPARASSFGRQPT